MYTQLKHKTKFSASANAHLFHILIYLQEIEVFVFVKWYGFSSLESLKKPFLRVFHTIKKTAAFFPLSLVKETRATVSLYCFFSCKVNEHSAQISDSYCTEAYAYLYWRLNTTWFITIA